MQFNQGKGFHPPAGGWNPFFHEKTIAVGFNRRNKNSSCSLALATFIFFSLNKVKNAAKAGRCH